MKTCPYCAEEIQDAAIKCRWCLMWLVDDVPAGAEQPPPAVAKKAASKATQPAAAIEPEPEPAGPASAAVAAQAVQAPVQAPVQAAPVQAPVQAAPVQAAPVQAAPVQAAPVQAAPAPAVEAKIEFTHTGSRFLLGYGVDYFGIWDRNAPQQAIERFPRNDQGWATAWARYASIEPTWMDLRTGQKSG